MRLKEIEIKGFKSFSDKTKIEFKDGITAVVGPNGSGKSNISDAVRWVLGEQSIKTLRGSKMEDVIFSGTSKRKALGFAEVTITFDNKSGLIPIEYEEVAITRRVFRSGESEYFLNKNGCRLKDIRELLMDTGIGKEGYSIIGQGRIGEILSNNPAERRGIFEEAAGIIKYKSKKDESLRKLKRTDENLIRINDLLSELKQQESSLKRQADKATQYQEIYGVLKELEINLLLDSIEIVKVKYEEIKAKEIKFNKDLEDKEILFTQLSKDISGHRIKIDEKEETLRIQSETNINSRKELDSIAHELQLIKEKINHNDKDLLRLEDEKASIEEKIKALTLEEKEKNQILEKTIENLEEIKSKFKLENGEVVELLEELKVLEVDVESSKDRTLSMYNTISDKKSELNSMKSISDNMDKRLRQLEEYINNEKEKLEDLKIEKSEFLKYIMEKNDKYDEKQSEYTKIENDSKILNDEIENFNDDLNKYNISIERNISSYNLYKKMEDSYEGYYKGVKNILKISDNDLDIKQCILGVVADLIRVDEKYEVAISTALGSSSQFIVTNNQQGAKKIISKLYETKGGRVTCLPIDKIQGKSMELNEQDRKDFNVIGIGSEIIQFDDKYKNIVNNLLGRTIIIDNMDNGIKLSNKYKNSLRIVTLNGNVINPGGSMTGGSQTQNGANILSRKNQIEKIYDDIKSEKIKKEDIIKNREIALEKISNNKKKYMELASELKALEFENVQFKSKVDTLEKEEDRVKATIETYNNEVNTLSGGSNDYIQKSDKLVESINILEKDLELLKESIRVKSVKVVELNERKDLESSNLTNQRITINKEENEIKNLQQRINFIQNEISSSEENLKTIVVEISNRGLIIETLNKDIEKSNDNTVKINLELDKGNELESSIKSDLEKIKLEFEKLNGETKKYYNEKEQLKEDIKNLELNKVREEMTLESHNAELRDKYELEYDEALEFIDRDIDIEDAKPKIKAYREKISRLGTINISAIEEYNILSERLGFITEQKDDMLDAKKDLEKVINKIENTMKDIFVKKFEEINENFKEIFKIMFNGGQASLTIEDKSDILNSGIEIQAMPPGKKLQNLSSLSGGERSLIAVSLLFAILKIKPSPFCILDEIDAALDEANIGRYTSYLDDISEKTQFIIITHRKRTMEMADMLYGVTMEEQGVSKLISIELKDYEEDAS